MMASNGVNLPKHIYMVGIGGIGMSALAQLLKHRGHEVAGADRESTPTTDLLARKGIAVALGAEVADLPHETELLIYSDAVPAENPIRMAANARKIKQTSYFEALGAISREMRTVAVAGTNGKTTTTGMIAKVLADAGVSPTAVVGSIVQDFGSNFLPGESDILIVEACEYREHFLEFSPEVLVVTNIELDHTDFFPSLAALESAFRVAVQNVREGGVIVANPNDVSVARVLVGAKARIVDYRKLAVGELKLPGEFNRENARAALAAALAIHPDLSKEAAGHSLSAFNGSWRRFEYKGETSSGALVFDDYAHHPTAVLKTIEAARQKFPGKRIVVAFHPHLYSRTKSFLNEFAAALATADKAFVAPIYAARETPDPSVSQYAIAEKAGANVIALGSFDEIRDALLEEPEGTVIITMGAGDIYKVADEIVKH